MKILKINKREVMVDDEDFEWLNDLRGWAINTKGYPILSVRIKGNGKSKTSRLLSRMITFANQEQQVDHKDGNPLNNQKNNLRLTDAFGNMRNRRKTFKKCSSKYKGVCISKNMIIAQIAGCHIGYFEKEEDAARAYDEKARELFGEYARLNFPV